MTTVVAFAGDTHLNSLVGLCPPEVQIQDGGTYRPNPIQRDLWRWWLDYWAKVREFKEQFNAPVLAVFMGDIVDADAKRRSYQMISRNPSTILDMAIAALEVPAGIAERALFIRGTPAHAGKGSWYEEELARDFGKWAIPNGEEFSWREYYGYVENVPMHIQHATRYGGTEATKINPLHKAADQLADYYDGGVLPQLAMFGHVHRFGDTYDNHKIRVVTNGCFSAPADYINHKGIIGRSDYGGSVAICDQDRMTLTKIRFKLPKISPSKMTRQILGDG